MRPLALVVSALLLAGCSSGPPALSAPPPRRPVLIDRDNVARHLPKDLKLNTVVSDAPGGGMPVYLEERLAEAGVRVSAEGKLIAADGKEIYYAHYIPSGAWREVSEAEREERKKLDEKYHVIDINDAPGKIFC
jgi:hypothetical protein